MDAGWLPRKNTWFIHGPTTGGRSRSLVYCHLVYDQFIYFNVMIWSNDVRRASILEHRVNALPTRPAEHVLKLKLNMDY